MPPVSLCVQGAAELSFNAWAIRVVLIVMCAACVGGVPAFEATANSPTKILNNGSVRVGLTADGRLLVSIEDGDWMHACTPKGRVRDVIIAREQFIAVGSHGFTATSSDGIEWSQSPCSTVSSLYAIAFGNNRFVAVGDEGAIVYSCDGVSWKYVEPTEMRLRGVAFGRGRFLAVGHEGLILRSNDGTSWRPVPSKITTRLESVAFGNEQFVAAGWKGTIVVTDSKRLRVAHIAGEPKLTRVEFRDSGFEVTSEGGAFMVSENGLRWNSKTFLAAGRTNERPSRIYTAR